MTEAHQLNEDILVSWARMTRNLSDIFPRPRTTVVIEEGASADGWPCLRVYSLGDGFDQFDEYSEHQSLAAAHTAAAMLSRRIGAPVFVLSDGGLTAR